MTQSNITADIVRVSGTFAAKASGETWLRKCTDLHAALIDQTEAGSVDVSETS